MAAQRAQFLPSPFLHLLLSLLIPSSVGAEGKQIAADADATVSRAFFPIDGDVAWVVQVSDLHLSTYHPDRAEDLVRLLAPALSVIRPSLLLITGDITDAKNRKRTSTRQDESEWAIYRSTIDAIVAQSDMDKNRIFDIRGNHDKYGVPSVGNKLDFFSTYSVSSQLNRLSTIHSISLLGNDRKYVFLGIDDTMSIGIRGPSNLFGHPSDKRIDAVNSELLISDNYPNSLVTKVVFGHFPMSFTTSSRKGDGYESIFAKHSISAYLCGHLHSKFSKQLWRLHAVELISDNKEHKKVERFWEWELGDWKESRLIRVLAVDGGTVSFLDFDLAKKHQMQQGFPTTILVTYPTDSRSMNTLETSSRSPRNDINALVFSAEPILNVTAIVFDSFKEFKIVEEIPLQLVASSNIGKPLFHAKWNAESYKSKSPARYWLQVFVVDSNGKETLSKPRPFSIEGKKAVHSSSWLNYLIFEVKWEELYLALLWSNLAFLVLLLFFPKLIYNLVERSPSYQNWGTSRFSSPIQQGKPHFWVLWFLMEGSKSNSIWISLAVYLFWLIRMPWFWGHATSENGDIAQMYLSGWKLPTPNGAFGMDKIGSPDVMTITLPFLYLVAAPVIILIYGLFAERAAVHLSRFRRGRSSSESISMSLEDRQPSLDILWATHRSLKDMIGGRARRLLILACLITILVHFKLCYTLMLAYGAGPVAMSPALSWAPPLLLVAAMYSTATTTD